MTPAGGVVPQPGGEAHRTCAVDSLGQRHFGGEEATEQQ
jgi:hypothetical protein